VFPEPLTTYRDNDFSSLNEQEALFHDQEMNEDPREFTLNNAELHDKLKKINRGLRRKERFRESNEESGG